MSKVIKKSIDDFEIYLKDNFPEHARRILKSRSNASFVRFFYPFVSFLLPFMFFSSSALVILFLKNYLVENAKNGRFSEIINENTIPNFLAVLCSIGFGLAFLCFVIGFIAGIFKARDLIFESEQLETGIRHIWLIEQKANPKFLENNYLKVEA
jgi:hypothetical protein